MTSGDDSGRSESTPFHALLRDVARAEPRSPPPGGEVPTSLLHYRILDRIGQGGMGTVYRAEDTKLRRIVAIKQLAQTAGSYERARSRLRREARAAAALQHPNIVTVFAIEEADGKDFIVMEYVEGVTVDALVARGPLELGMVLSIGADVADALECAHSAGVVHRDVKPANIIVSARGRAKVLDFGIAKPSRVIDSGTHAAPTADGALIGTIPYMPPEQLNGAPADNRSDLFALGCVLYEAATGRRPFNAANLVDLVREITTRDPPLPSTLVSSLPPYFDAVVVRALAKSPDQRFTSGEEMATSLRYVRDRDPRPPATSALPAAPVVATAADGLAKTITLVPLVKGVWFLTARRFILERHGDAELHAVVARMKQEHRAVLLEPLASAWYHEDIFADAIHAAMHELAGDDPNAFSQFIEDCTVLGINTFFRILLRTTSTPYLLRKMPVLARQYRRNDWSTDVDADNHRATIRYGNCPYLADPVYRIYLSASLHKIVELGAGKRPQCETVAFTSTSATYELRY